MIKILRRRCLSCRHIIIISIVSIISIVWLSDTVALGADWPAWRCDAAHSGSSKQQLPQAMYILWQRQLARPQPAWPDWQYKLMFDKSYEPVVAGKLMYVPSMVNDTLTAYDTDTGREKWRFCADGPIRFAPVAAGGRVYFGSDDGYVYCLVAQTGKLIWKLRGGPDDRHVLGNDRLISMWPVRGAPVLYHGKIYFAAGIWPFMGIFIYAVDARTGKVVWLNSTSGSTYMKQQHYSPAFAGVAPQGYIAANKDKLILASRTIPACFDRHSGKLVYYHLSNRDYGKYVGGYKVSLWQGWFFNNEVMYNLKTGKGVARTGLVITDGANIISLNRPDSLIAYKPLAKGKGKGKKAQGIWKIKLAQPLKQIFIKAGDCVYGVTSDNTITAIKVAGGNGISPRGEYKAKKYTKRQSVAGAAVTRGISWQYQIDEPVWDMLAADNKLFVVTVSGKIYCFGAREQGTGTNNTNAQNTATLCYGNTREPFPVLARSKRQYVSDLLNATDQRDGYCVVVGLTKSWLLTELLQQSRLRIIALGSDGKQVDYLRHYLADMGVYGKRITILAGTLRSLSLSPYMANLILIVRPEDVGWDIRHSDNALRKLYNILRPYGGTLCWLGDSAGVSGSNSISGNSAKARQQALYNQIARVKLAGAKLQSSGDTYDMVMVKRMGALPGSDSWTGQYGNTANTVCSDDDRVRAPLGLLWFGERSDFTDVLPRHGHGPPEQVVAGRLFIEGINKISARDVYTGRILWRKQFDNLNTFGLYYDKTYKPDPLDKTYNQEHLPGANVRGTNFAATVDRVYVTDGKSCYVLDAGSGKDVAVFKIPVSKDKANNTIKGNDPNQLGYIGVYKDYLIITCGYVDFTTLLYRNGSRGHMSKQQWQWWLNYNNDIAGRYLVIMDRYTGKVLWYRKARYGFIYNAIVADKGVIYCLDNLPPYIKRIADKAKSNDKAIMHRLKQWAKSKGDLLAIDINTGKIIWRNDTDNHFGTWLGYSQKYNVLLEAQRRSRDNILEPNTQMRTYNASSGKVIWDKKLKYNGPCILHGRTIITQGWSYDTPLHTFTTTQGRGYDLLTGKLKYIANPVTGKDIAWQYWRNYGCNTAIASKHLLTFRSAAAGYFNLDNNGGTANLGGFKSGCTSNLVAADGVLNAPDYTRTCTCSYQNQTSLALVYMPDVEQWSFNKIPPGKRAVVRFGLNFGAPGDRKGPDGTLWLDWPSVGGPSPDLPVKTVPSKPKTFAMHSLLLSDGDLKWVEASGLRSVKKITVPLYNKKQQLYTVRLHFMEPDDKRPSDRLFDVALQGKTVLKRFDIVSQAGGIKKGIVREFSDVSAGKDMVITLTADKNKAGKRSETIICGIEIIRQ